MTGVLDHGSINLVESMGSDLDIVNAARTSFDAKSRLHGSRCPLVTGGDLGESGCMCGTDFLSGNRGQYMLKKDAGLINFLMKHRHGTPFEMVQVKFEVEAPIFVFREWHRHRIASINEMSGRYVELERKFYVPDRDDIREQVGKPGNYSYERIKDDAKAELTRMKIWESSERGFDMYQEMLEVGIAKEVARLVLPVNTYSKMVWSANLRAVMNFLSLRNAPNAQLEIRKYAEIMEDMMFQVAPVAMQSFVDNGRQAP